MGKIRCPECGTSDCTVMRITLGRVAEAAIEFGFQAVKSRFTGKMDYQKAIDNSNQRLTAKNSYCCNTCGYAWESSR